ncbi:unnamed protein product [Adineta steineri]|uniref:Uncharacterized protein n=1 Tax=Adineta steineri TaxID=433720 RepID=A0A814DZF2_9BILA|nr:unnamed protein product [Adineta steineri]CAF0980092.1 unnamed protein product [Adineta steineri]CAF1006506.1 unnamed protein product [Adineta steineri]CAF1438740.1 unnamed protein product [Adineta steineri]
MTKKSNKSTDLDLAFIIDATGSMFIPTIVSTTIKPVNMRTQISNISLADDGLLDVIQAQRLVRKYIARNKLEST